MCRWRSGSAHFCHLSPWSTAEAESVFSFCRLLVGSLPTVATWSPLQAMPDHNSSDVLIPVNPTEPQPGIYFLPENICFLDGNPLIVQYFVFQPHPGVCHVLVVPTPVRLIFDFLCTAKLFEHLQHFLGLEMVQWNFPGKSYGWKLPKTALK